MNQAMNRRGGGGMAAGPARSLEEAHDAAGGAVAPTPSELPPAGKIIADLESFFRQKRDDG